MHKGTEINKVVHDIEYNRTHVLNAKHRKLSRDEFKLKLLSRLPNEFKTYIQYKFEKVS